MNSDETPNPLCINEIAGTNLWIGNLQSLKEIPKITRHRGRAWTILSVVESKKILHFAQQAVVELQSSTNTNHEHHTWQLADNSQCNFLCERLMELLGILDRAQLSNEGDDHPGSPCLVHCAMGISRSAAVCAAWLLHTRKQQSLASALASIRDTRPSVQPNLGLLASLRAIEQCQGNVRNAIMRMKPDATTQQEDQEKKKKEESS